MLIVGIGGTVSPTSSSDTALRITLEQVEHLGVPTRMFSGAFLKELPMYDPTAPTRTAAATEFVETLRSASGIILSSAAYHGSISGMLKNALDYTEDMSRDSRVYFSGLPVGSITVAKGWQAGANTLTTLRSIVHALRGWPTPYGCVINTAPNATGQVLGVEAARQGLSIVASEVVHAVRMFAERPDREAVAAPTASVR